MSEIRITQDGNTYRLRWRGKRGRILGGMWIKGKAQNLTVNQFKQWLSKIQAKLP